MYKYELEKYKPGGSNRYVCPSCGKRKCFARYVDTVTGKEVADECGKCNHVNSCGYHLTPSEYYEQHPSERPSCCECSPKTWQKPEPLPRLKPIMVLDKSMIDKTHSMKSNFMDWLAKIVKDKAALQRVYEDYRLGASRRGDVIFWLLDREMQLRTGKVMKYAPDGHRQGNPDWVHSILQRNHMLPPEWTSTQCLFGEHLLSQPESSGKPVFVVESEKTAVLCAAFCPQYLWLATGGCSQLSPSKISALRGRKVILLPDSGQYDKWYKEMAKTVGIDYRISKALENYPPNTDIADLLLQDLEISTVSDHLTM